MRKILFILLGLLILVSPFQGVSQYTIGGSAASLGNDCYRLTLASNSQAGYVYRNTAINLNQPFNYKYQVNLGTNNGGADGIVFVLRGTLGTPYIATGGGGLGFNNLTGTNVGGTMGVEVDTWQNTVPQGDPAADHIGIISQGSTNHTGVTALSGAVNASATSVNVEDGNFHTLNIRWDPAIQLFEVYFDCDYRVQYQGNLIDSIFNGDSLVHWGFVGTTGGANNLQRFCFTEVIDSLFTPLDSHAICNGDSVQLNAGTSALSYLWSPSSGLNSITGSDPWAAPSITTDYVVTATYQCDTIIDTGHVAVIQPNFTASSIITEPLCLGDCDGAIDLSVSGPSNYGFIWNTTDTTEDISNLCAGSYDVIIQDTVDTSNTHLCYIQETITITEPTLLTASIINQTKTSCPDGLTCDASAEANAMGGTSPYSFVWGNAETTSIANSLCADSNFVTVTDANGCDTTANVIILVPDSIVTTGYGDTLICISNVAVLNVASTGGTPPFTYTWHQDTLSNPIFSTLASPTVNPVTETVYYVASIDSQNCVGDTSKVLVKVRPELGLELPVVDTICPYDDITITVEGTGGDTNYTYAWSSGVFGPNALVSPDFPTWYTITLSDACGTPAIVDSVFVQVGGYSDIKANISVVEDTLCLGEQTVITATAIGGFRGPAEYKFLWSHTANKNSIQTLKPNTTTTYYITVEDLCISEPGIDSLTVHVGEPEIPIIDISPKKVCAEGDVRLRIRKFDENSRYDWTFGDILKVNNHQYDTLVRDFRTLGCYDLNLSILTEYGCESSTDIPCAIEVLQKPTAAFSYAPDAPTNIDPFVMFTNKSINANRYTWFVQGQTFREDSVLNYDFMDTPYEEEVKLVAYHNNGCTDTTSKMLLYRQEPIVYVPSSFTPNGDDKNEVFYVVGENISFDDFELAVYDRWGREMFYSKNPLNGWDGSVLNSDQKAPPGSYVYSLRYRNGNQDVEEKNGIVILGLSGNKKTTLR
jgi:gliding motility-associated-like protein